MLSRFNRILASSVYQHTEMAAMLALHDFQVGAAISCNMRPFPAGYEFRGW